MTYFRMNEFACKCCGRVIIDKELVAKLERAREIAGVPFVITSGYRCPNHNVEVNGAPRSAHMKGLAADIMVDSDATRMKIVKACIAAGFIRMGVGDRLVHVDVDPNKSQDLMWVY